MTILQTRSASLVKTVRYFEEQPTSPARILGELLSPVIEKQPSAAVKRNVEKYAVPAAVSPGGFFSYVRE